MMSRVFIALLLAGLLASCRSTHKIQTAIGRKDTAVLVRTMDTARTDTAALIRRSLQALRFNRIDYTSFNAKVNVDYKGGDGKSYNVNAVVRMYRDSAIWISANAVLGIEAMRVLITRDSVKLLNKLNKTYTARSVDYLQDVTSLPLDLPLLQDLIVGNPLFIDSSIVSYSSSGGTITMMSVGQWFKNLLTLAAADYTIQHSKLDDRDIARNRTADLTYGDYQRTNGKAFSTERRITVSEKTRLDIQLDFKQYDFDKEVSFPFSIPKNYDRD